MSSEIYTAYVMIRFMHKRQDGFAPIFILVFVLIIAIGAFAFWRITTKKSESPNASNTDSKVASTSGKIKHLGINLDYYDPATNKAGDIEFMKLPAVEGGLESVFMEYGRQSEATSAGPARRNPQPTFLAPLGTKVHAIVDGTVTNIPKLYSGDYSVHVQADQGDNAVTFETEHVINVLVSVGDKVKAGDVIAEVSDYDARNIGGLGLFEIGVLVPGNPPKHVCTFDYLEDSIKTETLKKIRSLEDAWEKYIGNDTFYDQAAEPTAGCSTSDAIEG